MQMIRPDLRLSVSVTTRSPRPQETDGAHYHFISSERFDELRAAGHLLEHNSYAGHSYGTPSSELHSADHLIIECDVNGAEQLRSTLTDAVFVFLAPPSPEALAARLRGRGTDNEDAIASRLEHAQEELSRVDAYDHILVSSSISDARDRLLALLEA